MSRLICQVEGMTQAGLGETMPATISVSLTDAHGNPVKVSIVCALLSRVVVSSGCSSVLSRCVY